MKWFWLFLVGFVLLNSGCAFTPQAVVIKPELVPVSTAAGQGHCVLITVADERPRSTLGTRGGEGVGAELTVAGDLTEVVRKTINDGLQQRGFSPIAEKSIDGRELRVEIRNLDYRIVQGFWSCTLSTECGLKAICMHGSARPFEQLYRGEFQESIQVVQSAEQNEKYVNTAISKAINSLLQDSKLIQCLVQ
jgi:uncharacterized lipoprotein YajG